MVVMERLSNLSRHNDYTPHPLKLGRDVKHQLYEAAALDVIVRNPIDRVCSWSNLAKWVVAPLALVTFPLFVLSLAVTYLYQKYHYGLTFPEIIAKLIVRQALELDPADLESKRDLITETSIEEARDLRSRRNEKLAEDPENAELALNFERLNLQPCAKFIKLTTSERIEEGALVLPALELDGVVLQTLTQMDKLPEHQKYILIFNGLHCGYETSYRRAYDLSLTGRRYRRCSR